MNDKENLTVPKLVPVIEKETTAMGFKMASDYQTGSLLRSLASTKPSGNILELGTGTGLSTCWLLEGMDRKTTLMTVDNDPRVVEVAKKHLSEDTRVKFHVADGSQFLKELTGRRFDLIFADTWPGKYWDLEGAIDLLEWGGIYIIDDMLPQPNWPADHPPKVEKLIQELESRDDLFITKLNWSTGIIVVTRKM